MAAIYFRTINHRFGLIGVTALFLSLQSLAMAQVSTRESNTSLIDIRLGDGRNVKKTIIARNTPLKSVLNVIAEQEDLLIHSIMLSNELINVTCSGFNLKRILECLINRKADLVVRYKNNLKSRDDKKLAEIWVLGAQNSDADNYSAKAEFDFTSKSQEIQNLGSRTKTDGLLTLTQSQNPEERAVAAGAFLTQGYGNPDINLALEQALADQDPNVRSQALSSYSHREGGAAVTEAIQTALNDVSPAVRLTAVDNITNDVDLLQRALNDSDESVRILAALKLKQLTQ